jgi:allophanate hydrolase
MTRNLGLDALQAEYRTGNLTPRQLLLELRESALGAEDYNAWIHLLTEEELQPYLERLEACSPEDLPLYGVPFGIKDNIDLAGIPTTAACPAYAYLPEHNAFVVQRLLDAGAVPLGKTNLDQFATGLVGTRSPYGECKNVFNEEYISGGSSAGSAVATALGLVSFALGTDTAGSGRVPAAFNNLVGHKPTRGLLSNTGLVPACKTLDCISLFALNTDDAASLQEIVAQTDTEDAYSRSNPHHNRARYYRDELQAPFRFGVPDTLEFHGNSECESLFFQAVDTLCSLGGAPVEIPFTPFLEAARLLYEGPWVAERWLVARTVSSNDLLPVIGAVLEGAGEKSAGDCFQAQYALQEFKAICDRAMATVDFVLTPTTPTVFTRAELGKEPVKHNSTLGTYTNYVNLLDYAATAVPIGALSSGVHWGVTLVGPAFSDIRLLSYAGALHKRSCASQGATAYPLPDTAKGAQPLPADTVDVVVCGAHMTGMPLNWQLTERGASLADTTQSAADYRLYALPDGNRPALVHSAGSGEPIDLEVWRMPMAELGSFVANIPPPLAIGKVNLLDGRQLTGFVCEENGLGEAHDITSFGGWRQWLSRPA